MTVTAMAICIFSLLTASVQGEEGPAPGAATWVSMEGQAWDLGDFGPAGYRVATEGDEIRFTLAGDDYPVSINFNVDRSVLEAGAASYSIPQANQEHVRVDLSLFNTERPGRRMQRRVVFSEGTIEIAEIAANRLRLSFKGAGHPLMDPVTFPIEGAIDAEFLPAE